MQGNLLTIAEAAKRVINVTEPTLRGMIDRNELEAVRVGRRLYIHEEELRRRFSVLYRTAGVAR
jgi:excisionase family DNA binding protein